MKIESSLCSRYYAEACNEWRGPSPRLSVWATLSDINRFFPSFFFFNEFESYPEYEFRPPYCFLLSLALMDLIGSARSDLSAVLPSRLGA